MPAETWLRRCRAARLVLVAVMVGGLSACSSFFEDAATADANEPPVEELYAQAEAALARGSERQAATLFDEVERLYPTSTFAKRSILRSSEASYRYGDYDKSILAAERYLDFYPSDEQAPYAQYLVAMSHYDQISDVGRDQLRTKLALQSLRELVARYPDSPWAREAELKLELTQDHLAGKEMEVGRFYLKRGNYIAAINRFRTVVEQYQTTSHIEEALHRLVESYLALGVTQEAKAAAAVLGHNFPGSPWYLDSFALLTGQDLRPEVEGESWLSDVWDRVVRGEWL